MRKKIVRVAKRITAFALAAAMTVSGTQIVGSTTAKAAGTPAARDDNSVIYGVDCGDVNPKTAPEDGPLGTHNSVTDQVYGEDAVTGYKWGAYDSYEGSAADGVGLNTKWTWANEWNTIDQNTKDGDTFRYCRGQMGNIPAGTDLFVDYKFELEPGKYYVEVGLKCYWDASARNSTVYTDYGLDTQTNLGTTNFSGKGVSGKITGTVKVTGNELTVNVKAPIVSGTSETQNVTYITIKEAGAASIISSDMADVVIPGTTTGDLELPSKGTAGSTITWVSNEPAVISNDGKVTRPGEDEEDAEVVLTATFSYQAEDESEPTVRTKDYTVKVTALNSVMNSEFVDSSKVVVTDEYYAEALNLDVTNLLALDADRLLAGFRETAMYAENSKASASDVTEFMKKKTRYGGYWENSLIGSHTMGHYMTAIAQAIINPGVTEEQKTKLTDRLNYLVTSLKECQEKTEGTKYEGYIFGAELSHPNPDSNAKEDEKIIYEHDNIDFQFDNVEVAKYNIATEAWVPWYTMHKILAGLTDAYAIAGNEEALEVANALATWISNRANGWNETQLKNVLNYEYGGMNDVLYHLYSVTNATNKEDFKKAAHRFDEVSLFERVLKGNKNVLANIHANTTIPKFLGALARYEVDPTETKYLQYAESFWQMVHDHHEYITGGNSMNEHFQGDDTQNANRNNINNETCNTYNMLKLSRRLFVITGDKKYADYYENTLINAIMASQNHDDGRTMYFQPMASGYHKVFGTIDNSFWCCTGSGMENFTKLQDSIYFKKTGSVIVNQYLASKYKETDYVIEQTGDLSKSETMTFTVSGSSIPALKLRIPDWVKDEAVEVKFGEEDYKYTKKDGYINIPSDKLSDGTSFTVTLPMETVAYGLTDGENVYGFKYGPYVLSAKLGSSKQQTGSHGVGLSVPASKAVTSENIGITSEETVEDFIKNINEYMTKSSTGMNFSLRGTNFNYTFTTHYNQYKENYGIYWKFYVDTEGLDSATVLADKSAKRLSRILIDEMSQVSRGQYELRFKDASDQSLGCEENNTVADTTNLNRYIKAGGSLKYLMKPSLDEDNYLLVTYAKEDDGKTIKISVGDNVIANETLDSKTAKVNNITLAETDEEDFYQVLYKISKDTIASGVETMNLKEGEETETKEVKILPITFTSGKDGEDSAKINKSISLVRAFNTENQLTKVEYKGEEIKAVDNVYTVEVPYSESPKFTFTLEDSAGYISVDGKVIDESSEKELKASGTETEFTVSVYAEDFVTKKDYKLVVQKDYSGVSLKDKYVQGFAFEDSLDGAVGLARTRTFVDPYVNANATFSYEEGIDGKSIKLNGSNGLKLMDDVSMLGESYTISFWMKSNNVGGQYNPTLAAGTFMNPKEYWLSLTLDGKIWSNNVSNKIATEASGAYVKNQWQNVVISVDGSDEEETQAKGNLYVDGKLVSSGKVHKGIMKDSGGKLYFGINAWDAIFSGNLDEVMVFNAALSEDEVQALASKIITVKTYSADNTDTDKDEDKDKDTDVDKDKDKDTETDQDKDKDKDQSTDTSADTSTDKGDTTGTDSSKDQSTGNETKSDSNSLNQTTNTDTTASNNNTTATSGSKATATSDDSSKKASTTLKTLKLSSVKTKKGTKKITGKVSVKKATVKIKVGRKAYKKAKVSGKKFTLKVSKLKKGTKISIRVTKKGYKTLTKTYKVK